MALANQMVQVRTEAKASPTMTVLTTMSAAMNMPHGDRSRGNESMAPVVGSVGADSGVWTGAAGAVLAARLSEDPAREVLLRGQAALDEALARLCLELANADPQVLTRKGANGRAHVEQHYRRSQLADHALDAMTLRTARA